MLVNLLGDRRMSFLDLVKVRQSVREYLDKPVEREKIERCLEAARLAPSATNAQPWKFIVIDKSELKEKVAKMTFNSIAYFNKFSLKAPVLILVISESPNVVHKIAQKIKNKSFILIDIGIATEHLCLQAVEEGLGTCILGWFDEKGIKKLLNIPDQERIELIVTMGYPVDLFIFPKKRKTLDQIRGYNSYSL